MLRSEWDRMMLGTSASFDQIIVPFSENDGLTAGPRPFFADDGVYSIMRDIN